MNSNEANPISSSTPPILSRRPVGAISRPIANSIRHGVELRKPTRKPLIFNAIPVLLMVLAFLVTHAKAATVTWYGSGVGGGDGFTWTNSHNWVGNVVPGPGDDVIIGIDAADPAIQITTVVSIKSVNSQHAIAILNGSLTVTSGASSINAATTLTGASLYAKTGATLSLPMATSYTGHWSVHTILSASGAGSKIDLSHLTTFLGGGNSGGGATNVTSVLPTNGGEIDLAGAISSNGQMNDFTLDNTGGILGVSGVTSLSGTTLTVGGGQNLSFTALTTLDKVNMAISGGSQVAFPVATSYTGHWSVHTILSASGAGSKIDLSHLTTFLGGGNSGGGATNVTSVLASNGGQIDLAGAISTNGNPNIFTATYGSASDVPFAINGTSLANTTINFVLGFAPTSAPTSGTSLVAVRNTGVEGTFTNLGQGQLLNLAFGGNTYSFRSNYLGGTGKDLVLDFLAPIVTTLPATNIGQTGATLNGTVNPNGLATTYHFDYGTDPTFAVATSTTAQSAGSGTGAVPVQAPITGLNPNTQYYFRLVASNSAAPVPSTDAGLTFTTLPITYTVTPSAGAGGSISPNTPQVVNSGGSVGFIGTPNTGYTVDQWLLDGGPVQTGGGTYTLNNVTANHTVQVTFKVLQYTVTPSAGANGSISPNTAQTVNYNGSVGFTGTPNTGYTVDQWLLDGTAVQTGGTTYTLNNVTANHTVQVTFKLIAIPFTVTPIAGPHGSITPNTPQNGPGPLVFTGIPDSGYMVNQWLLDGTPVQSGGAQFTLANVTANHTVKATFTTMSGWFDGFETYTLGTVPTPNWANSGNTAVQVENTVVSGGSKAVSLYGVVGGNWGALIHRQLNLAAPLLIECDVRNGTESLSGNHPFFVGVALNSGPSWTTNQRGLLYFAPAGGANNIYAGDPASSATPIIGHYTPAQWHHVAIAYERPDSATVKLSYWVDGSFLGSFLSQSYSYESSLSYLSLNSGEGTSWFDNVRV